MLGEGNHALTGWFTTVGAVDSLPAVGSALVLAVIGLSIEVL